eukprot:m.121305 g.121305  ORF g.121305 m.121305 type:complete len:680 (-) comp9293_c0_seq3:222-2261(-)
MMRSRIAHVKLAALTDRAGRSAPTILYAVRRSPTSLRSCSSLSSVGSLFARGSAAGEGTDEPSMKTGVGLNCIDMASEGVGDPASVQGEENDHVDVEPFQPESLFAFLLGGEAILFPALQTIRILPPSEDGDSALSCKGTFLITNYRVVFQKAGAPDSDVDTNANACYDSISIPLSTISYVHTELSSWVGGRRQCSLSSRPSPASVTSVDISCKNFRNLRFKLATRIAGSEAVIKKLLDTLIHFASPRSYSTLFAFDFQPAHRSSTLSPSPTSPDLELMGPRLEAAAREMIMEAAKHCQAFRDDMFTTCDSNVAFDACGTYPAFLIVPAMAGCAAIKRHAVHYVGERFPVWCFTVNHLWLCRSGAPINQNDDPFAAMLAHMKADYETVRLEQLCPPVDQVCTAYEGLRVLCEPRLDGRRPAPAQAEWLSALEATGWPALVHTCLKIASNIADTMLRRRICVLVTGGEVADFDSVVCALVQLIIDPYYRTEKGFQLLVMKEFVLFGHPFGERLCHLSETHTDATTIAPVFLLFLDCVHQLMHQFPLQFYHAQAFLVSLWDEALACRYGTFLLDCERDRAFMPAFGRTHSVWEYYDSLGADERAARGFTNPFYAPSQKSLRPQANMAAYVLWDAAFLRFCDPEHVARDPIRTAQTRLVQRYLAAAHRLESLRAAATKISAV